MRAIGGPRKGFTLLELLVVMGIMALLAGIVLAFYAQASQSQRRFRSISNMRMIYTALQQYQLDERGLPPFSPALAEDIYRYQTSGTPIPGGPGRPDRYWYGLWALVETGALESVSALRDPAMPMVTLNIGGTPTTYMGNSSTGQIEDSFFFCNYQTFDPDVGLWMYLPHRGITPFDPDPLKFRRQLWPYPDGRGQARWMPSPSTVVLWSPNYRSGKDSATPVLYFDGSVQLKRSFYNTETSTPHPDPAFIDPLDP